MSERVESTELATERERVMSNRWHNKLHDERVEELLDNQSEHLADMADSLREIAAAVKALVEKDKFSKEGGG